MLTHAHTVLPARDLSRARAFYHDKLGLDPAEEHSKAEDELERATDAANEGAAFDSGTD